jgi:hypothetical protein
LTRHVVEIAAAKIEHQGWALACDEESFESVRASSASVIRVEGEDE